MLSFPTMTVNINNWFNNVLCLTPSVDIIWLVIELTGFVFIVSSRCTQCDGFKLSDLILEVFLLMFLYIYIYIYRLRCTSTTVSLIISEPERCSFVHPNFTILAHAAVARYDRSPLWFSRLRQGTSGAGLSAAGCSRRSTSAISMLAAALTGFSSRRSRSMVSVEL